MATRNIATADTPNFKKGDRVVLDTGKKATSGPGVVLRYNTDEETYSVKLDNGYSGRFDEEVMEKEGGKRATKTASKPAAKAEPAKRGRPKKVIEEAEADDEAAAEFEEGQRVSFNDDDETQTGTILKVLTSGKLRIELDDDAGKETVDPTDEDRAVEVIEDEDENTDEEAADEVTFSVGDRVTFTNANGDDDAGEITRENKSGSFKVKLDSDDSIETHGADEFEMEEVKPAKRGRPAKATSKPAEKAVPAKRGRPAKTEKEAPAKRTRNVVDEEPTEKDVSVQLILAADDYAEEFAAKPSLRTLNKLMKEIEARLRSKFAF